MQIPCRRTVMQIPRHRTWAKERVAAYSDLVALWGAQEALLQAYRTIFITAQSIVFAVAAVVAGTSQPWLAFFLVLLGGIMMGMWKGICKNRAADVSFVQWLILKAEQGARVRGPLGAFKDFQDKEGEYRQKIDKDSIYLNLAGSLTRKKMDVHFPALFFTMWLLLSMYVVWRCYCVLNEPA